jgi:hypothetical protein
VTKRNYPNNEEVRAWANDRFGDVVRSRGRMPHWVVQEWNKTHPKRKYVKTQAHHGTLHGATYRKCSCAKCSKRLSRYHLQRKYPGEAA